MFLARRVATAIAALFRLPSHADDDDGMQSVRRTNCGLPVQRLSGEAPTGSLHRTWATKDTRSLAEYSISTNSSLWVRTTDRGILFEYLTNSSMT